MNIISANRISFSYDSDDNNSRIRLIDDLSVSLGHGETLLISGRSGSGKTTLLKILSWLLPQSTGSISFMGRAYESYDPADLRKNITFVSQNPYLAPMSVFENIRKIAGQSVDREEIFAFFGRLGFDEKILERSAAKLSAGEKMRVAIVRAISLKAKVILLDEPTAPLDGTNADLLCSLIKDLSADIGTSFVVSSHDKNLFAQVADQQIELGKIS
jgi:ABC-type lipoprotein export system ATPase subunit